MTDNDNDVQQCKQAGDDDDSTGSHHNDDDHDNDNAVKDLRSSVLRLTEQL